MATIEPIPLDRLAKAITGIGTQSTAGIYLPIQPELDFEQEESKTLSPLEKLEEFWHVASPNARRLAKLLAAAPRLRLPIIRLVRASFLKGTTHVDEIELLLSGLIQVAPDSSADEFAFDDIEYAFIPEIREELLDALPKPDAHEVLKSVSKYVEEHLGDGVGFAAVITEPKNIDSVEMGDFSEHFAVVSESVLKRLGGGFKKVLEQLEAKQIFSDLSNKAKLYQDWYQGLQQWTEYAETELFVSPPKAFLQAVCHALVVGAEELPSIGVAVKMRAAFGQRWCEILRTEKVSSVGPSTTKCKRIIEKTSHQ